MLLGMIRVDMSRTNKGGDSLTVSSRTSRRLTHISRKCQTTTAGCLSSIFSQHHLLTHIWEAPVSAESQKDRRGVLDVKGKVRIALILFATFRLFLVCGFHSLVNSFLETLCLKTCTMDHVPHIYFYTPSAPSWSYFCIFATFRSSIKFAEGGEILFRALNIEKKNMASVFFKTWSF